MEFRHAIYRLYDEEHVSERKIAQMLGLSPSTVHYWITRRGESATTKSGRPRVTDAHTDQNLYEASRKDPFLSAVDLQKEWTPACSVDTVRNRLKQKGLKCRTPARKPFLTQFHRQMRYVYAHSKLHWSVSEWHRVVFSDEKIFRSSSRGALRVYRPVQGSDRFDEQYLVHSSNPIYGRPRFTLCVWMAFGGKGKIRTLHRIERPTLNTDYYINHILSSIETELCEENEEKELIFMQDLSSVHTSRQTTLWLQEHNVNVMHDWPPKGPDMNPVENVWAELVRRLEIHWRQTGVRNRDQLWEDVLQVFHELPEEYFENLIRSMPRRVRTVSSKHGGWAKY
ncbi:transposable element Tc1 transposase [Trichonephila clavata]|uniref:Transposable element Tc1 transposase n=1 Tax=Trichonephila clavata TaxID=2740835 RepID=A0A8X6HW55_TRICU|nr:transposable element Tc1 transposase [Trichonephila clavata]GFR30974.1 transposable element Tc1 transposase [Trichonephila clavata]